jgi:hypothetical protein
MYILRVNLIEIEGERKRKEKKGIEKKGSCSGSCYPAILSIQAEKEKNYGTCSF